MTGVQERLQRKYIWWQEPHLREERFIAQVMNIGDFDDVQILLRHAGEEKFRRALRFAEPGWFNARSWSYWHLRLGLIKPEEEPPPLPVRHLHKNA